MFRISITMDMRVERSGQQCNSGGVRKREIKGCAAATAAVGFGKVLRYMTVTKTPAGD